MEHYGALWRVLVPVHNLKRYLVCLPQAAYYAKYYNDDVDDL